MNKQAVNTFKEGLVMDLNPLANDNKSLTNALNATFITLNGNELMLQNDMGNGRINRVRLDDGYIPVGIKEYGGIIYIASYNPKNGKGQIGSFPYPKLEWEGPDLSATEISLDAIYGDLEINATPNNGDNCPLSFYEIKDNSVKLPLLTDSLGLLLKIHSGDSFSIKFNILTVLFLRSNNINIKLIVKTSSNYYTISDNKEDILSGNKFVYGGTYAGYLYLLIDIVTYNNFEIDYLINGNGATIYPRAYNNLSEIYTDAVVVNPSDSSKNTTNLDCDYLNSQNYILINGNGTYLIYPITLDGGYIENLERKVTIPENIPCGNKHVQLFKYKVEDGILSILLEYQDYTDTTYRESGDIKYIYRLYPIKSIKDIINSSNDLNNLHITNNQTSELINSGYHTKSGVRTAELELPNQDIYLLVVSSKTANANEQVLFTRFVYGTSRYNNMYDLFEDFNTINEGSISVDYTLDSNIFEASLSDIRHYHEYNNTWSPSKDLIKYSDTYFEECPDRFKTAVDVLISKTEESIIECSPELNHEYIFDKELFTLSNDNIQVLIQEVNDLPLKNSNNTLYTEQNDNSIIDPTVTSDSILFHRHISSDSSDDVVQQDRVIKTLAPVFDPYNTGDNDELLGYSYSNNYMESVVCGKNFLSNSASRLMNVYYEGYNFSPKLGFFSFLEEGEESLTSGSVKLSNLLAAILGHSTTMRSSSTPSIFDIFAGGVAKEAVGDGWQQTADKASLEVKKSFNKDEYAGIKSVHSNDINGQDDWMIATCLNIKGKPMPINIASRCINKVFSNGTFIGSYVSDTGEIKEVKTTDRPGISLPQILANKMDDFSYINVGKKLLTMLSQIFTLQNLLKNIYIAGPSSNNINYNIQDNSYLTYTCSILKDNSVFSFTKEIDELLERLQDNLIIINGCPNNLSAINYIGSIKSKTITNTFNYGHLVNLGSSLFGNVLSLYENAYDNNEIMDESGVYTDEKIYFLNAKKVNDTYSSYSLQHDDEIWSNSGINFNPEYHCFTYDLGKLDYSLIDESVTTKPTCIFDFTGRIWEFEPLTKNFSTVFKAQREYSNVTSSIQNNYILLKQISTDIKTTWVHHSNTSGPGIVYIDFGLRGLCKSKNSYSLEQNNNKLSARRNRIATIINYHEEEELRNNGFIESNNS